MKPLVSVIMGVLYRGEDLSVLENAINSILKQTFSDFELLISSDGSSDAANTFLHRCATEHACVKIISSYGKTGLPEKLNACLSAAKGEFVARMDDDDFSHPNRFEKQLAFLNLHPEIAFVGCNVALMCHGQSAGRRSFPEYPAVQDFYITQPYIHPALMFRREALERVKGYSEKKSCTLCEDYDLLLRLYAKGFRGANLQEILFTYSVPMNAKGNRTMRHRWNESVTRWQRFRELGVLPEAIPYVIKPILAGFLPEQALKKIKESRRGT